MCSRLFAVRSHSKFNPLNYGTPFEVSKMSARLPAFPPSFALNSDGKGKCLFALRAKDS